MTLILNDTEHNRLLYNNALHYAECHILFVVIMSVVMLNVMAPLWDPTLSICDCLACK
jgi:hypothetical protein